MTNRERMNLMCDDVFAGLLVNEKYDFYGLRYETLDGEIFDDYNDAINHSINWLKCEEFVI